MTESNQLMIDNVKNAVSYIRNEDKRMEEDDYFFYEEAIKIVCKAALKWCEHPTEKLYTEPESAEFLKIEESTLLNLRKRHKVGFIKGRPVRYFERHLTDYLLSQEVVCAVSQNSSSSLIEREISNLPIGTSNSMKGDLDAALLGVSLARKTMRRKSHLPTSSSNGNGHNQRSQPSL